MTGIKSSLLQYRREPMEVDLKEIEKAGFSAQTPIIITNSDDMMDILKTDKKSANLPHWDTFPHR